MDCPNGQLPQSSDSRIVRALAGWTPPSDGDLQRVVQAIRQDKKDVYIPGYSPFSAQGWEGLFGGCDSVPQKTKRDQGSEIPEAEREEPALSFRELEGLLTPPEAFFRGHLAKELPSIIDAIGCTPLVCLSRIAAAAGCACQLLGKCEYLSAGGSTKDRIARGMVQTAEATGRLAEGAALIEPTSGNTGIGLALVAAVKGYRSVAVMPMKMSAEKHTIMKALGATILRTPTKAAWDDQDSHIALSIRLEEELQNQHQKKQQGESEEHDIERPSQGEGTREGQIACILDQYRNVANPLSHFFGTGEELLQQTGKELDMVVICAGTGGSLTGIGKRIKAALPNCLIVAVDPVGSILADPNEPPGKPYFVEGIGYDFVPTVLDREVADFWVKVTDRESLLCSRLLIRLEGMLVGGSSGTALAGAFKAIEHMGWTDDKTKRIALILPDGSRNYTSKFVSDEWMVDKGFLEPEALDRQYPEYKGWLVQSLQLPRLRFIAADRSMKQAAALLMESPQQVVCVVDPLAAAKAEKLGVTPRHTVVGTVSQKSLLMALGDIPSSTAVGDIASTDTPIYSINTQLSRIAQSLELRPFVLIESGGLVNAAVGEGLMLQAFVAKMQEEDEEAKEAKE